MLYFLLPLIFHRCRCRGPALHKGASAALSFPKPDTVEREGLGRVQCLQFVTALPEDMGAPPEMPLSRESGAEAHKQARTAAAAEVGATWELPSLERGDGQGRQAPRGLRQGRVLLLGG